MRVHTDKLNEVHFLCIISTTEFVAEATVAEQQFKVAPISKLQAVLFCLFVTEERPIKVSGGLQSRKLVQAPITIVPNS